MDYRKFLVLFLSLLAIPIVKADGCGIVCPHGNDLLTFSLATLCNFFTWGFCHIFAFIIVAISGIVIFIFWHNQQDEKKKKIKLFLYALFGIFALVLFYPYIKAWTGMAISTTPPTDSCGVSVGTDCILNVGNSFTSSHTPTGSHSSNKWRLDSFSAGTYSFSDSGIIITPDYCDISSPGDSCDFTVSNFTANVPYSITASSP